MALGLVIWLFVHGIGWIKFRRVVAELRARGEVLDVEALAPPPVPDEENAAVILKPVLERARDCESELYDDPELEGWYAWALFHRELGDNRKKLQEVLSRHGEIFDVAAEALKRPACRFVDYSKLPYAPMSHFVGLRCLGRLFRAKLRLQLDESPEKAAETLEHLLAISETLGEESFDMSLLTRIALFDFFVDSLRLVETVEGPLAAEWRKRVIRRLAEAKLEESSIRMLTIERAVVAGPSFSEGVEVSALWMGIRAPLLPGTVLSLRTRLLSELTRMIDAARDSHADFAAVALSESARKGPKDDIAGFHLQAWHKFYLRCLKCAASRDLARLALALGLYRGENGEYPETLQGLAPHFPEGIPRDPFTGEPFVYGRTEEGFLVYSLGPDGKDDGGTPGKRPLWPFDGDICWRHPAEMGPPAGNVTAPQVAESFRELLEGVLRVVRARHKGRF